MIDDLAKKLTFLPRHLFFPKKTAIIIKNLYMFIEKRFHVIFIKISDGKG